MGLHFRYQQYRRSQPIVSLKGRMRRPRPVVGVGLAGPNGYRGRDAVVDTAADDTVFPDGMAAEIGVDLTSAPTGEGVGIGNRRIPLRYAEVTLRLTDGHEFREWLGWVGFTAAPLARPLLGFAGCLEYFTATFYGDREELELEVNSSYPGT